MWAFLVPLGLFIVGLVCYIVHQKFSKHEDWTDSIIGHICVLMGILWLTVALIALPCTRWENYSFILKLEAMKDVIEEIRINPDISEFERLALQKDIIEMNKDLASKQYYSRNVWTKWFFPKELQKVKPIKNILKGDKK